MFPQSLSSHSNLNAALGGPNASVFGAGSQGAFYSATASGAREYLSTIAWTIDATSLSGHLIAGLIDNQTLGAGFTSLAFTGSVRKWAGSSSTARWWSSAPAMSRG